MNTNREGEWFSHKKLKKTQKKNFNSPISVSAYSPQSTVYSLPSQTLFPIILSPMILSKFPIPKSSSLPSSFADYGGHVAPLPLRCFPLVRQYQLPLATLIAIGYNGQLLVYSLRCFALRCKRSGILFSCDSCILWLQPKRIMVISYYADKTT